MYVQFEVELGIFTASRVNDDLPWRWPPRIKKNLLESLIIFSARWSNKKQRYDSLINILKKMSFDNDRLVILSLAQIETYLLRLISAFSPSPYKRWSIEGHRWSHKPFFPLARIFEQVCMANCAPTCYL